MEKDAMHRELQQLLYPMKESKTFKASKVAATVEQAIIATPSPHRKSAAQSGRKRKRGRDAAEEE
eukprot:10188097-Alexandrium_andersonii.AAC.1